MSQRLYSNASPYNNFKTCLLKSFNLNQFRKMYNNSEQPESVQYQLLIE